MLLLLTSLYRNVILAFVLEFNTLVLIYSLYYEALETASGELNCCFQPTTGMPVAAAVEATLFNSASGADGHIPGIKLYSKEIDIERLRIQLQMLPELIRTFNEKNSATAVKKVTNLRTLCEVMSDVSSSKSLLCEIFSLLRHCPNNFSYFG